MSLLIDVDKVISVLLADGWHDVLGRSFNLDSYEYHCDGDMLHSGGSHGITAIGFEFREFENIWIGGPLTAVLGVRMAKPGFPS